MIPSDGADELDLSLADSLRAKASKTSKYYYNVGLRGLGMHPMALSMFRGRSFARARPLICDCRLLGLPYISRITLRACVDGFLCFAECTMHIRFCPSSDAKKSNMGFGSCDKYVCGTYCTQSSAALDATASGTNMPCMLNHGDVTTIYGERYARDATLTWVISGRSASATKSGQPESTHHSSILFWPCFETHIALARVPNYRALQTRNTRLRRIILPWRSWYMGGFSCVYAAM